MTTNPARALFLLAALVLPTGASALTAVDWTTGTSGMADGITVTMSDLEDSFVATADLSGFRFEGAPLSASAETVQYRSRSDWSVTLSEPVDALLVYTIGWRGVAAGIDPATYNFDEPFTILSGLLNAAILGNEGDPLLALPANEFHDGILLFCGPISSLGVETNIPSETSAFQDLTLAVAPLPETPPTAEAIDWATPTLGTASAVEASLSNVVDPALEPIDLTGPDYAAEPLSFCTESISYGVESDWTLTLSEPVEALLLYLKFWRGSTGAVDPVTYQFDAPFTIESGLSGAAVSNGNTLLSLSDNFHDGILRFQGPIADLSLDTNATSAGEQGMAFAVAPEPGGVLCPLASLAAVLALRRRA
jgi:hypothetical protein